MVVSLWPHFLLPTLYVVNADMGRYADGLISYTPLISHTYVQTEYIVCRFAIRCMYMYQ